jgi:type IV fimbrial biogenesis protein FimT
MGVFMKQTSSLQQCQFQRSSRGKGFTLVELLVTLAVASVLLGIAEQGRFTAAANEILSAMNYAKGEALRRSRPVSVTAAAGGWVNGWVAFVDPDRDGVRAPTELLLRQGNPLGAAITVTAVPTFVTFDSSGRRTSNQATQFLSFAFYKTGATIESKRTVCVTQNGRIFNVKGSAICA